MDIRSHIRTAAVAALLSAAVSAGAMAAATGPTDPIDLDAWTYDALSDGFSADAMIGGATVFDQNDQAIGGVKDFIVGPHGKIQKVVIEAGGFLGLGATDFAYPWNKTKIKGVNDLRVEFDKSKIADYSQFKKGRGKPAAGADWRMTQLLNDNVEFKDGTPYGKVSDVIFERSGKLDAVIVYPDIGYGVRGARAWPFQVKYFNPHADFYTMPYVPRDINKLEVYVKPKGQS
jgi:sporulation protein YlmC with PRC-barrel domain